MSRYPSLRARRVKAVKQAGWRLVVVFCLLVVVVIQMSEGSRAGASVGS